MRTYQKAAVVAVAIVVAAGTTFAWSAGWAPFADGDAPVTASPEEREPTSDATTDAGASPAPTAGADESTPAEIPTAEPTAAPSPTAVPTSVIITYAAWVEESSAVEVGAYATVVGGVGECTLTLTRGTTTRTASAEATLDVSTTGCGRLLIPGSDVPTGTWTAVVAFSSPTSSGQSEPAEVVVP